MDQNGTYFIIISCPNAEQLFLNIINLLEDYSDQNRNRLRQKTKSRTKFFLEQRENEPIFTQWGTCDFFITAYSIGCFKDTGRRAIAPLEGRSRLLKGNYRRRWDAVRKCALAAAKRRYRVYAVQHGGWCASARRAHLTYGRYGKSNRCRNGKGGPWANSVYILRGQ